MNKQYPRVIQPTAVLVGDLIELTDESRPDWLERDRAVRGGAGVLVGRWVMDNLSRLTVRLLDRPTPPIPTEPWTLIRAKIAGQSTELILALDSNDGRWWVKAGDGTLLSPDQITSWSPLVAVPPVGADWLAGHEAEYSDDPGTLECACGWRTGDNHTFGSDDHRAYARHLLTEAGVWA